MRLLVLARVYMLQQLQLQGQRLCKDSMQLDLHGRVNRAAAALHGLPARLLQ